MLQAEQQGVGERPGVEVPDEFGLPDATPQVKSWRRELAQEGTTVIEEAGRAGLQAGQAAGVEMPGDAELPVPR